jgi:hypothetical protein
MWRLIAPALAFLLLGASFLRAGNELMMAGCAVLLVLLTVPRPWAAWIAQIALVLAALRWLWLTWLIGSMRASMGVPYGRMAIILSAVALFTLLAMLVFHSRRLRQYYRLEPSQAA